MFDTSILFCSTAPLPATRAHTFFFVRCLTRPSGRSCWTSSRRASSSPSSARSPYHEDKIYHGVTLGSSTRQFTSTARRSVAMILSRWEVSQDNITAFSLFSGWLPLYFGIAFPSVLQPHMHAQTNTKQASSGQRYFRRVRHGDDENGECFQ